MSKECRVGWAVPSLQPWLSDQPRIAVSAAIFSDLVSAAPAPGEIRGGARELCRALGQGLYQSGSCSVMGKVCDSSGQAPTNGTRSQKTGSYQTCPPKGCLGKDCSVTPDICAET